MPPEETAARRDGASSDRRTRGEAPPPDWMRPYGGECFFVVGCARSGTTLLRVMLNRHSRVAIPTESLFVADYLRCRRRGLGPDGARRLLVREYEVGEWGLDAGAAELTRQLAGLGSVPDLLGGLHELYAESHGKTLWGQKTPRLVRHLDALAAAFPAARFVHIARDPRAVAWSLIRSPVHRSNALYAARRWRLDVGAARRHAATADGTMLEVTYEELLGRPEATLRRICGHLGLEFEPGLLDPAEAETREYESGFYGDVHRLIHRRIDPSRIDAWRGALTAADLALVEAECGELMAAYGYRRELDPGTPRPRARALRLRLGRLAGAARQALFYLGRRPGYLLGAVRRKVRLGLAWRDLIGGPRRLNY